MPPLSVVFAFLAFREIRNSGGRISGFVLAVIGLILAIIGTVSWTAGIAIPLIHSQMQAARRDVAIEHAREVGRALVEFENRYGSFPSREVYQNNTNQFKNAIGGDSANDLLGLLMAGGIVEDETIFRAGKRRRTAKKQTDSRFNAPEKLLGPGECGFGYVMLEGGVPLSTARSNGACPLIVTPLEPGSGGSNPKFSRRPYHNWAVYLRIDQAVKSGRIDRFGRVRAPENRHTLFETGPDTVWGDKMPDVRPPE